MKQLERKDEENESDLRMMLQTFRLLLLSFQIDLVLLLISSFACRSISMKFGELFP